MSKITNLLGDQAAFYLEHTCRTIDKSLIHIPSSSTIDDTWISSDRNIRTLSSLQALLGHGRLANTGYVSILPVDQGIEHTAGASFAPNPLYFDPENIVKLAIEGGCNAIASTFGVLGSVARKYAHKIPFIAKLNLCPPSTTEFTLHICTNITFYYQIRPTKLFFLTISILILSVSSRTDLFQELFYISLVSISKHI